MKLDDIQQAAQEQFARQSRNSGAGHTGRHLASLGHEVTPADLAAPMLTAQRS